MNELEKEATSICPRPNAEKCRCKWDAIQVRMYACLSRGVWKLGYTSLEDGVWQVCQISPCPQCGKQFCVGITERSATLDARLAATVRHLNQRRAFAGLNRADAHQAFIELFRQEDRPVIQEWLARPENQSVWTMYRKDGKHE